MPSLKCGLKTLINLDAAQPFERLGAAAAAGHANPLECGAYFCSLPDFSQHQSFVGGFNLHHQNQKVSEIRSQSYSCYYYKPSITAMIEDWFLTMQNTLD